MITPFEKAGYTKETKFKVIRDYRYFKVGDIVTLDYDDGSKSPRFISSEVVKGCMWLPQHATAHECEEELEVYEEDSDGFIKWDGGEMPVPVGTMVHVKYRDGKESIVTAGLNKYSEGFVQIKGAYAAVDWYKDGWYGDIVAYRLHTGDGYVNGVKEDLNGLKEQIKKVYEAKEPFVIPTPEPYVPPTEGNLTVEDQQVLTEADMEGLSLLPRIIVSQKDNYNGHGQLSVSCELSSEDIKTLLKELEGYYEKIDFNYNLEARLYSDGSGSIYVCNYWNDEDKKHPLGHKDKLIFSWGEKE